ncbi:MAG: flagellar basal body-associated FliL family protein [Mariprofundaceae bacterium]|nr:flagellar basal body-associated FliL family protein [Mariprofundaceae bacterium]
MAKDDKASDDGEKKSGGGILPLINTVLLVLVLGVGGFNAWTLINQQTTPAAEQLKPTADTVIPEAADDADANPVEMDLDNVTVNLADPNRFLRVKIKLSVRSEEAQAKIEANKAEINDLIITAMSGKRFEDIRSPQGKYELKEELVHRINKAIGGSPVRKLYFTDFVSQ